MRRSMSCLAILLLLASAVAAGAAGAQTPTRVRLAAAADCARNVNCIPGFKRAYAMDPTPQFIPLKVADAGIQALDDGTAEVALAFSSNPQLSRPDILELADDRHMISADHVVPVVRSSVVRRYGRRLRRALDDASKLLSTLELRGLNQQVFDGRLPEAVGGEFADTNGLGGGSRRVSGPAVRIAYQDFDENKTLAYMYAEALRGAGIRVTVRAAGGLRPAVVGGMRNGRIDLWPGYSGSLRGYLGGDLRRALARIGAQALALSPAQDRNGFAMRRDVAKALGVSKLSDLRRYWETPARTAGARAHAAQAPVPGDPRQGEQWSVGPDSMLNLPAAWALSKGRGVTVAIVDTGAKIDHPDLAPNIWTNFDEIPGNGVDDDHNGYVDDVHGVDLTSKSSGQDLTDGNGHGTHVAGIVAAAANGKGVVGVAPQAKLMIVKVLDSGGAGTTGAIAEGVRYAAANGARIINLSLGGDRLDTSLQSAIQEAGAAGTLVVTSAGNSDRDIDTQPSYPASLAEPNLITVASTDPDAGRDLSGFSNFGRLDVQVAAPGGQILSTAKDGSYVLMSGTSMAAPAVSGVAALAASVNPRLTAPDLRALLMQNATRSGLPVTAGYVDALQTVVAASSAAGYDTTQPPRLKILSATVKNGRTQIQAAVLGSTTSIRRYKLTLGGRVAELAARPSPFSIKLAGTSKRVKLAALNRAGRPVTAAQSTVAGLRKGKGDVGRGSPVGT